MKQIEKYEHHGKGYNPFIIREGWQVAQLNYVQGQGVDDILKIDVHNHTDEVFVLINGTAVLIAAEKTEKEILYEMIVMKKGIVYNIPKGVWHNIALSQDAQVVIIENDDTHLHDFGYYFLNEQQRETLYELIASALK